MNEGYCLMIEVDNSQYLIIGKKLKIDFKKVC